MESEVDVVLDVNSDKFNLDFRDWSSLTEDKETYALRMLSYGEFEYDDSDTYLNEIAEFYCYSENAEHRANYEAFKNRLNQYGFETNTDNVWLHLTNAQKRKFLLNLINTLELIDFNERLKSMRCVLYLVQGCWDSGIHEDNIQSVTTDNICLLLKFGVFDLFLDLLIVEISNSSMKTAQPNKPNDKNALKENESFRVILTILYTIIETMRFDAMNESSQNQEIIEDLRDRLVSPYKDELLIIRLLKLLTTSCSNNVNNIPIKKVLLLIWKILLFTLGGMKSMFQNKIDIRQKANLSTNFENTINVARKLRPFAQVFNSGDAYQSHLQVIGLMKGNRSRRILTKQNSLGDCENIEQDDEPNFDFDSISLESDKPQTENDSDEDQGQEDQQQSNLELEIQRELKPISEPEPEPELDPKLESETDHNQQKQEPEQAKLEIKGKPWITKSREKDILEYLQIMRLKYIGYTLENGSLTVAGFPKPIIEGIAVLNKNKYIPYSELQIKQEEASVKYPLTAKKPQVNFPAIEQLYEALLPNLTQYVISLLKILLSASPTTKSTKIESTNVSSGSGVFFDDDDSSSNDIIGELKRKMEIDKELMKKRVEIDIDLKRHREIIIKAVSALLLILLKQFKLNHVYQFEFLSQHLVYANCIPLILKFFNQKNIVSSYVASKTTILSQNFPYVVLHDTEFSESVNDGVDASLKSDPAYQWRNVFSCINLLRILNKLIKWKLSRIMMILAFKSAPILKRTLKIPHPVLQLYVLKLLKMQAKYLGRQWRKSNMKIVSEIYNKVRHRFNDDWAFGNDIDVSTWDFENEESILRTAIDNFNLRRYFQEYPDPEYIPQSTSISVLLAQAEPLPPNFKSNYEFWLEKEVYEADIDWDVLLNNGIM